MEKKVEKSEINLRTAFTGAEYHPKSSLADAIWQVIVARQERMTRFKMWMYSLVGAVSFFSLFPVIASLMRQFVESGFSEYVSLAFSDSGSIALYWKEFALSLADSLPTTSLILSLSLLFVFLLSVRNAALYFRSPLHDVKYA